MPDPTLSPLEDAGDPLPTHASLIERLQQQADASAWNRAWRDFYFSYHPVILRFACRRGLSIGEAEELAQEVVSGVAQRLEGFRYDPTQCRFSTWLLQIAHNRVADRFRRQARRQKLGEEQGHAEAALELVADPNAIGPDLACQRVFEQELVNVALERVALRVKPMYMRLYVFHVIHGHTVKETVAHFRMDGVKAAYVYLAKFRILPRLKAELASLTRGDCRPRFPLRNSE